MTKLKKWIKAASRYQSLAGQNLSGNSKAKSIR